MKSFDDRDVLKSVMRHRWDFPLPSTGRGIEGEGWEYGGRFDCKRSVRRKSPLTPALSQLRGEGERYAALLAFGPHSVHWIYHP